MMTRRQSSNATQHACLRVFGEACKLTRNTKNLGLIVDNKLNFNEHLLQVEGKVARQLKTIQNFCSSNWGLKQALLIKLYKTLMLP